MRKFINFFLVHPIWGNAFIVLVLIFGIFSIVMMRKSFFPELDPKTININVFYSGASPSEMEEGVTIKIEQAVKGLDGIDEINSTSAENTANVSIKAFQDTDIEELLSEVENTVNSISSFPQGSERPIITRIKSGGMGSTAAFIGIAAKTENARANELTDLASKVERDLLNTKEITEIRKNGFPEKEIAINVRENDLLRYGMSIQEVSTAIASKNLDLTAGLIRGGVQEMSIRSNNRGTTAEEIDKIIIRTTRTGEKIVEATSLMFKSVIVKIHSIPNTMENLRSRFKLKKHRFRIFQKSQVSCTSTRRNSTKKIRIMSSLFYSNSMKC